MKNYIGLGIVIVFISIIYFSWFSPGLISAGDFWYYFPSMYGVFDIAGSAWSWQHGNGLGINSVLYQAIQVDFGLPILLLAKIMKLPWQWTERLGFFYPFLIIGVLSSYFLFKKILNTKGLWYIAPIVMILNTYILTVVAGGQIIIGIAYALSPYLLYLFISTINGAHNKKTPEYRNILLAGIVFGIEVLLDLRIAYVVAIAIFLYWMITVLFDFNLSKNSKALLKGVVLPFLIGFILNSFWVVQLIFNKSPLQQLGDAYSSVGSVVFLSFARLENSISLLHPNWPENLFGKVSFMRPEFLIIPILAFSSLLFLNNKTEKSERKYILFFAVIGVVGALLSKGAQEPFGNIYLFMFENVPGMEMFRDPTKFYLLTAVSFSILIPYALYHIIKMLKKVKYVEFIIPLVFVVFWCITILPAITHQIGGSFKHTEIPSDYMKLERLLSGDPNFSRTFWLPQVQRFAYYSDTHPAMVGEDFLNIYSYKKQVEKMSSKQFQSDLADMSVKYVIVPIDSEGEVFLDDRRYSQKIHDQLIHDIAKIRGFIRIDTFKDLAVFQLPDFKGHMWSYKNIISDIQRKSAVEYVVSVRNASKGDLIVFSERFDPKWSASTEGFEKVFSKPFKKNLNSFILNKNGSYNLVIYYEPQKFVNVGIMISIVSLAICVLLLLILRKL